MENNKCKQYYLTVKNTMTGKYEKVFVTEEVYRAYKKPIRKEQSRERRENRCLVKNKFGNLVRCTEDCNTCEYYLSRQKPGVNGLSLDTFKEQGLEIADTQFDPETELIEQQEKEALHKAIATLTLRQQEIVRLIYFEGCSQEEVRQKIGVAKSTMSELLDYIRRCLKKYLQNS